MGLMDLLRAGRRTWVLRSPPTWVFSGPCDPGVTQPSSLGWSPSRLCPPGMIGRLDSPTGSSLALHPFDDSRVLRAGRGSGCRGHDLGEDPHSPDFQGTWGLAMRQTDGGTQGGSFGRLRPTRVEYMGMNEIKGVQASLGPQDCPLLMWGYRCRGHGVLWSPVGVNPCQSLVFRAELKVVHNVQGEEADSPAVPPCPSRPLRCPVPPAPGPTGKQPQIPPHLLY